MEPMQEIEQETQPTEIVGSSMLLLMRKLERMNILFERMIAKGLLSPEDLAYANLQSTLSYAERIIRVRERLGKDFSDIEDAASHVREEKERLERLLKPAV